jgi:hypothetical protein
MSTADLLRGQEESRGSNRGVSPSSASGLSSPPRSSPEPSSPSNQLHGSHMSITVNPPGPVITENVADQKPPRRKPGRKPKNALNADSSATNTDANAKPKRTRKPRDPNAPKRPRKSKDANASSTAPPNASETKPIAGPLRQPPLLGEAAPNFQTPPPTTVTASQKGNNDDIQTQRPIQSFFNTAPQPMQQPPPPPPPPPARTSGQNYDPIRSNYDPVRETIVSRNSYGNNSQGSPIHPHSLNRASASPSISSLVDPPNQALASPSIATQSFFNQQQQARLHQEEGNTSVPPSPTANRLASTAAADASTSPTLATHAPPPTKMAENIPAPAGPTTITKKTLSSTANSSAAASPKPTKVKDSSNNNKELYPAPPPLPGSGIMGGTDGTEFRAPTIILSIPMNGEVNKYVNFSRLAEERYGWDALHPRLAAQRDRLARVAAAGAALERNGSSKDSGDEMSLDSDAEEGSNVEMGGMSDGRTGTDGGAKKVPRKRKMKEDEYDKDDGFVDDSELLWEEQAAAANDGFFVYSGPLVPEGEKPNVDSRSVFLLLFSCKGILLIIYRADGAPKRGRGRGSRGGARASGGRGGAAAAEKAARNGLPLSGPGSRGGSTTRKPRITKADRARMEQEKLEREKMGSMASMPSNYGGMAQLASASQMGTTPMVFNQ